LLLIKGAVPGGAGSAVVVTPAIKTPKQGAKVAKKA
jgi:ribosomal protein L3